MSTKEADWLEDALSYKVDLQTTTYRVSDFLGWLHDGTLELRPRYQRSSVWSYSARSFLIDSILHCYPIPLIVLQEESGQDDRLVRRVVDGQQRLSALLEFVDPAARAKIRDKDELTKEPFKYAPTETAYKGLEWSYADLPDTLRRRIMNTALPTVSVNSGAEDATILELYDRLNSTGVSLNAQELRYARRTGAFLDASYQLARRHQDRWSEWRVLSETQVARMTDIEFTSELLLLIKDGVAKTGRKELDRAYTEYAEPFQGIVELEHRFDLVMDQLDSALAYPNRPDPVKDFRGKAWFYAAFAAILRLNGFLNDEWKPTSNGEVTDFRPRKLLESAQRNFDELKNASKNDAYAGAAELIRAVSGSSSDRSSRVARAAFIFSNA